MYYSSGSLLAVFHACLYDFEDLTQNSGWTVWAVEFCGVEYGRLQSEIRGFLAHEIQIAAELHISAEPSLPAVANRHSDSVVAAQPSTLPPERPTLDTALGAPSRPWPQSCSVCHACSCQLRTCFAGSSRARPASRPLYRSKTPVMPTG